MSQTEGYSPLKKEEQARISKAWSQYRDSVGLEGQAFYELIQAGHSLGEASKLIANGSVERRELIEIWESIWLK
jgi:hypothetical protein